MLTLFFFATQQQQQQQQSVTPLPTSSQQLGPGGLMAPPPPGSVELSGLPWWCLNNADPSAVSQVSLVTLFLPLLSVARGVLTG